MAKNPITVILNSGKTPAQRKERAQKIQAAFDEMNIAVDITVLSKGQNYAVIANELVEEAKKRGGAVVAAGGDGSVNMMAGLCYKHGVTLGIIPMGTFNYFARNLQIPTDIKGAVEVIAQGQVQKATLGFLGEHVFLNKVSFGLWTRLIRQREEASSRFGRARIVAAIAVVYSMLQRQKIFSINMDVDGKKQRLDTPMVFVCNNNLQLENVGLQGSECTKHHQLAVIVMKKATRFQVLRFLLRGLFRNLTDEDRLTQFCANNFEVSTRKRAINLVIDGEIVRCSMPLHFHVEQDALSVLAPAPEAAA